MCPWEPVFPEGTTCLVMAGPGPGPEDGHAWALPRIPSSQSRLWQPPGAVGSTSLPTAQIPLLDADAGAGRGSGRVRPGDGSWGSGGEAWRGGGKAHSLCPPPAPREGCGGPWVGMILVKVGQVPALCSAGAGASLTVCVGGCSVGKGQCSSTSSISYSPTVLTGGRWCTLAAHLVPALGYVLFEDAYCQGRGDRALLSCLHIGCGEGWSEHVSPWAAKDLTSRDQGLAERFRKHTERGDLSCARYCRLS